MPSDMTETKLHAFVTEHGDPRAIPSCPSCGHGYALDMTTALWALANNLIPEPKLVRWAEASHLVPSADGGKRVALECHVCNRRRKRQLWETDRPSYGVWKRNSAAVRAARASIGDLVDLGYPRP